MKRSRFACAAAAAAVLFFAPSVRADDDPWTGKDKTLHFAVSSGIAAGGYAVGAVLFDERAFALATGAGVTVAAGVGKELADLAGQGDPSWKDLAWDGLGLLTGLAVAWGVDLVIRGVSTRHPAFATIRGGIAF